MGKDRIELPPSLSGRRLAGGGAGGLFDGGGERRGGDGRGCRLENWVGSGERGDLGDRLGTVGRGGGGDVGAGGRVGGER
jgi:hypothetical protein